MDLEIFNDVDDLINALAKVIREFSEEAIAARGRFNFVLSGGNSPRKLYELLASKKFKDKIDWDKTYFFFGDERFVPAGDSQRNSLMARETLFEPLNIAEDHIFEVDTSGTPEEAAEKYAADVREHFGDKPVQFDFILLGLGDNAHTASLFPNTDVLEVREATVKSVFVKEVDMNRITMTAALINRSYHIVFLVYGKNKAEAVYNVLEKKSETAKEYPARLIQSDKENIHWYLDTAAASRL